MTKLLIINEKKHNIRRSECLKYTYNACAYCVVRIKIIHFYDNYNQTIKKIASTLNVK